MNGDAPRRILVLGAGGHAHVVVEALARSGRRDIAVVGLLDDDHRLHGHQVVGIHVLGRLNELDRIEHDAVIVAIGDNATRRRIVIDLAAGGERFENACHPSVVLGTGIEIGTNVMMSAGVIVNVASAIGMNVILNTACTIDHHGVIEDHAHIGPGAHLGGNVHIGEGALLGVGAVVMPGRRVGPWCRIGAGAVVTKDIEPGVTVVGIPAAVKLARAARQ